jgi:hypothetical protein
LKSGIPTDPSHEDEYVEKTTKSHGLLVQWVEDFKSKFNYVADAEPVIAKVEEALKLYKEVLGKTATVRAIQKARRARKAEGSVLEYGLDYHLSKFVAAIKRGLPADPAEAKEYLDTYQKSYVTLLQWVNQFKDNFGEYEEAARTIQEVEDGLKLYQSVIGGQKAVAGLQQALKETSTFGATVENFVRNFSEKVKISLYHEFTVISFTKESLVTNLK